MTEPRLLPKDDAAAYCSVSTATFDNWVSRGLIPKKVPGTTRWDRKALDLALDKLSGLDVQSSAASDFDAWEQETRASAHGR
ncbi:hypothetical protein C8N35_1156 [Breoghania corrubedonensis]|uniref:Helix-turn-helix domain-containing protein n=1 Tax=Breoghania corrubedonensis TaxID=665038 RepID=A0A2T5UQU5_9HYPH|nr:DNA-binding protein [Breoghania corrubedonensis]PTW53886.1 hypothetical protein C8N35_1156 [Breoghania corrubedonensis]